MDGGSVILTTDSVRARYREAGSLIDQMKQAVEKGWHAVLRSHGVTEKDCKLLARAFVYPGFDLPAATTLP